MKPALQKLLREPVEPLVLIRCERRCKVCGDWVSACEMGHGGLGWMCPGKEVTGRRRYHMSVDRKGRGILELPIKEDLDEFGWLLDAAREHQTDVHLVSGKAQIYLNNDWQEIEKPEGIHGVTKP